MMHCGLMPALSSIVRTLEPSESGLAHVNYPDCCICALTEICCDNTFACSDSDPSPLETFDAATSEADTDTSSGTRSTPPTAPGVGKDGTFGRRATTLTVAGVAAALLVVTVYCLW